MTILAAITRNDIASYLSALIYVYALIIVIYILTSLIFAFGVRIPYARWSDALLRFLRDVSEPYLNLFRRFIPMLGPLDISPVVALIVLQLVGNLIVGWIHT